MFNPVLTYISPTYMKKRLRPLLQLGTKLDVKQIQTYPWRRQLRCRKSKRSTKECKPGWKPDLILGAIKVLTQS